jgi:hypothetical protein
MGKIDCLHSTSGREDGRFAETPDRLLGSMEGYVDTEHGHIGHSRLKNNNVFYFDLTDCFS